LRRSCSKSSSNGGSTKGKRKATTLPATTVEYLKAWMMSPEHIAHPYPTEQEKTKIMKDTGIELKQLTNWFVNNRKRFWKPRVEARLLEQVQTQGPKATLIKPDRITPSPSKSTYARSNSLTRVVSSSKMPSIVDDLSTTNRIIDDDLQTKNVVTLPFTLVSPPALVSAGSVSVSSEDQENSTMLTAEEAPDELNSNSEQVDACILRPTGETQTDSGHYSTTASKRKFEEDDEQPSPRPKYRRVSFDLWKEACQNTTNIYDNGLPSLEEATQLFGYSN